MKVGHGNGPPVVSSQMSLRRLGLFAAVGLSLWAILILAAIGAYAVAQVIL